MFKIICRKINGHYETAPRVVVISHKNACTYSRAYNIIIYYRYTIFTPRPNNRDEATSFLFIFFFFSSPFFNDDDDQLNGKLYMRARVIGRLSRFSILVMPV